MRKPKREKMCPFIDQMCLKTKCEIYNDILDRCEIGLIAYNLFKLSEVERQRLGPDPDIE